MIDAPYDCIVIGAGPAGLSASLFLARYLHRTITFHHNSPRNEYAAAISTPTARETNDLELTMSMRRSLPSFLPSPQANLTASRLNKS